MNANDGAAAARKTGSPASRSERGACFFPTWVNVREWIWEVSTPASVPSSAWPRAAAMTRSLQDGAP